MKGFLKPSNEFVVPREPSLFCKWVSYHVGLPTFVDNRNTDSNIEKTTNEVGEKN